MCFPPVPRASRGDQDLRRSLHRIAGKPAEHDRLLAALGETEDATHAYKPCARIARMALWDVHPDMQRRDLAEAKRPVNWPPKDDAADADVVH